MSEWYDMENRGTGSAGVIMKKFQMVSIVLIAVLACEQALAEGHGADVFEKSCASCHAKRMTPEETDTSTDMLAPPMNLLTTIIRRKTGNTRSAFVDQVVDFTADPAEHKVLAMKKALERFGLMPPARDIDPTLTRDDIRAVAEWLYEQYDYEVELKALSVHEAAEAGAGH